ncbi:hypothetical protein ABT279_23760 [Amycolatopsis sp. NPDC000673]|uniref:hypothetical protein n=1 Tax=unclassified Amycolatopsis TaxID=2618356 RepID=UPI00331BA2F5
MRATDPGGRSDLRFLAETPRVEELIARGLRENLARSDWRWFQTYLSLAGERPSAQYVPVFAEALDLRDGGVNPGDVLEYLRDIEHRRDIKDPSSVPAVERALHWRQDWDEFHDLAFKALDVLLAIDDDAAWWVIESVRDDDRERVREIARRVLARRANG